MNPETYNDDRLNGISREVYYLAMVQIKAGLTNSGTTNLTSEKLHALAATADAAACGFKDEEESSGY